MKHVEANSGARCITARGWEEREDDDNDRFNEHQGKISVCIMSFTQINCFIVLYDALGRFWML